MDISHPCCCCCCCPYPYIATSLLLEIMYNENCSPTRRFHINLYTKDLLMVVLTGLVGAVSLDLMSMDEMSDDWCHQV